MPLSKLIKISTCVLCLGTIVTGSMMAMDKSCYSFARNAECDDNRDHGNDFCSSGSSSSSSDKNDIKESDVGEIDVNDDDIDTAECNSLILTYHLNARDSEELIKRFKGEIKRGKSIDYAVEYAKVMVVNKQRYDDIGKEIAREYERNIRKGKGKVYANAYASLKVLDSFNNEYMDRLAKVCEEKAKERKSENYVVGYAYFKVIRELDDELAEEAARIYEENVKTWEPVVERYAAEYTVLKLAYNFSEEKAREGAELFDHMFSEGECDEHAHMCALLKIADGLNVKQAYDYISVHRELSNMKDKSIKHAYIFLKVFNKFNDDQTRKSLAIYMRKQAEDKSKHYAIRYAALKVIDELSDEKIERISMIYEQKMKEICDANYANKYAMLKVVDGLSDKQAEVGARTYSEMLDIDSDQSEVEINEGIRLQILIAEGEIRNLSEREICTYLRLFMKILKSGRSEIYAHEYVVLKIKNYDDSKADLMAKMYYQERFIYKNSDVSAREYIFLVLNHNIESETAHRLARIFEKNIEKGEEYAREYAKAIVQYFANKEAAKRIAEIYLENFRAGKGRFYASEYARLTVMPGKEKNPEKIKKMAEIFEKEMIDGRKNEQDARKYAKLIVVYNKSEVEARLEVSRMHTGMSHRILISRPNSYIIDEPEAKRRK